MKLTYLFHSGFVIEGNGYAIVIDYYKDTDKTKRKGFVHDELLKRKEKLYVLASHFHPDHFNPEVLEWKAQRPDIVYLLSKDILQQQLARENDAVYLEKGEHFEDENIRVDAFGSTDSGDSFVIRAEGKTIFHAGDLNSWHWMDESTREEAENAELAFLSELEDIANNTGHFDLAMFPVDPRMGTKFSMGAHQFVARIKTDIFVPMHFWQRPMEIEDFSTIAEIFGSRFVLLSEGGQSIEF